jgi:MFS family permease
MDLFDALIYVHVTVGTIGLLAFWVPILTRKGARPHRLGGRIACLGFVGAGIMAIAMALVSLFGPEERVPSITDRAAFAGLLGWMMLFLGTLTIAFADYGIAVVRHARERRRLRAARYQAVMLAVIVSGLWCGYFGLRIGQPTMVMVAAFGIAAMTIQQWFVWRTAVPPRAYIGEHFRALLGMGISAYTAFLSVGLIRLIPDHVFNPMIWAGPSVVGVGLIIYFTHQNRQKKRSQANAGAICSGV